MTGTGSICEFPLLAESGPKLTDRYWQTQSFNRSIGNGRNVADQASDFDPPWSKLWPRPSPAHHALNCQPDLLCGIQHMLIIEVRIARR